MYDVIFTVLPLSRDEMNYYLKVINKFTAEEITTKKRFYSLSKALDDIINVSCLAFSQDDRQKLLKQLDKIYSHCDSKYGTTVKNYTDDIGNILGNARMIIKGKDPLKNNIVLNFIGIDKDEVIKKMEKVTTAYSKDIDFNLHCYDNKLIHILLPLEELSKIGILSEFMSVLGEIYDSPVIHIPSDKLGYGSRIVIDRELNNKYRNLL